MIEAKVMEISPSEIKYKRYDNLDGPLIVITKADVLSIKYENGATEIINADTSAVAEEPKNTAIDPNKMTVGIIANPSGLLLYGPSISVELSKGNFNSEINLIYPFGLVGNSKVGIGLVGTFNYLWHGRIGSFYLGGGIGYIWQKDYNYDYVTWTGTYDGVTTKWVGTEKGYIDSHLLTFGLNIGYKFVTQSGVYFRTGAYIGAGIDFMLIDADLPFTRSPFTFYSKPDLAVGYSF